MTARQCADCDVPLRTAAMDANKMPGTKLHAAKGMCEPCYRADMTTAQGPGAIKIDHGTRGGHRPTLDQLFAERFAFEAGRRKRGVPPEGIRGTRWPMSA